MNAGMPALQRAFERAGFRNVGTVLSSGNVVFDADARLSRNIEHRAEDALQAELGRSFWTVVRTTDHLRQLLATDPYAAFAVAPQAKRVVSFLREPPATPPALPMGSEGAHLLSLVGCELFTAYVPGDKGPVFMRLIEKAFGTALTTRTWETVRKCARA